MMLLSTTDGGSVCKRPKKNKKGISGLSALDRRNDKLCQSLLFLGYSTQSGLRLRYQGDINILHFR